MKALTPVEYLTRQTMIQNAAFAATMNAAPLKKSFSAALDRIILSNSYKKKARFWIVSNSGLVLFTVKVRYITVPAIEALERFQNSRLAVAFRATAHIMTVL
jgi:hypothetical protein